MFGGHITYLDTFGGHITYLETFGGHALLQEAVAIQGVRGIAGKSVHRPLLGLVPQRMDKQQQRSSCTATRVSVLGVCHVSWYESSSHESSTSCEHSNKHVV